VYSGMIVYMKRDGGVCCEPTAGILVACLSGWAAVVIGLTKRYSCPTNKSIICVVSPADP